MTPNLLLRFLGDRRGNMALIVALAIIPLLAGVGVAVDLSNATRVRLALQDATDSAVLALGRAGMSATDAQLAPIATRYMDASYNYNDIPFAIDRATFDRATLTAQLDTSAQVPTTFMAMFNYKVMPVSARAVSKSLSVEIAMVLDTSGSMAEPAGDGTKIVALKQASKALFDRMYGSSVLNNRFSISVVPFSASVNVGAGNANAAWIDKSASKLNGEDFETAVARQAMLDPATGMKNISWGGCVISREKGLDVTDLAPSAGNPDTLFVPWFAPDEPDDPAVPAKPMSGFLNNYLLDTGGDCTATKTIAALNSESTKEKQQRNCKYRGATPLVASLNGTKSGPNFYCDATAITALTNSRAVLDNAVDALQPRGNTNILEGFTWGWRTLSPTEPFTQGRPYKSPNNNKVIILMTDGLNTIGGMSNTLNRSQYTGYGFMSAKRLRNPATSDETLNRAAADAKTAQACANAKAKGITVYAIAFGSGAAGSQALLKGCATRPEAPFFNAPLKASELEPVFLKIAEDINKMRLAQ